VLLTVDTSRLERAKAAGVLQAIESDVLERRVPGYLQDDENQWFGFSQRARIMFYDKNDVQDPPMTYQDLADPKYQGMICIRSSSNVYTQTMTAALIAHLGEEATSDWAKAVVANFARDPQGGDTDQLRGIVSGECDISMSNTYYFGRAVRTPVDGVSDDLDMFGWVFPNQNDIGAHMNLSGGGVAANAPNKDNAIAFLEYLASDSAQQYFSAGNDEYPAVPGVGLSPSVASLGFFKPDDLDAASIADNVAAAQKLLDASGWK
jgi:iron(III) transport system substrate-binding protein